MVTSTTYTLGTFSIKIFRKVLMLLEIHKILLSALIQSKLFEISYIFTQKVSQSMYHKL